MAQATIWFSEDGYSVKGTKINGRRMAGESFLHGYLRHAKTEKFRACSYNKMSSALFEEMAEPYRKARPVETFLIHTEKTLRDTDVLYYSGPSINYEAWRRYPLGQSAYSICGITHTTSTSAVMDQVSSILSAPVEPWDALICTSNTVKQSIEAQWEFTQDYLERRLGVKTWTRPQTPILPIGIDCDDFRADPQIRAELRKKYGLIEDNFVIGAIARLSVHEKFDPLPFFLAVREAQKNVKGMIALIFCGVFSDKTSEKIFQEGFREILPENTLILMDGKKHTNRIRALSVSDAMVFPIDNIQETFGLSPIEGMAAGLPILTTDWNGMKDTVTPDVGFRVPTRMASQSLLGPESLRHQMKQDTYIQYLSLQTASTEFDVPYMAEKIALLANDSSLRKTMGEAAKKRADNFYDWSVVIPQMEALWDELSERRMSATKAQDRLYEGVENPIAPRPTKLFAGYPTKQGFAPDENFVVNSNMDVSRIDMIYKLRGYSLIKRFISSVDFVKTVYEALGEECSYSQLMKAFEDHPEDLEHALLWLLKFDLVRKV